MNGPTSVVERVAPRRLTLAFTGASGLPYGLRLLQCLLEAGVAVDLVYSTAAQLVARQECDLTLPAQPREATRILAERYGARDGQLIVYGREDWLAPMASGSNPGDGMVICPCTMGTLGAIAGGLADNLIERAADVMLKERRPLVLVPRETPLSAIHLENMLAVTRAGAVVLPASPSFYSKPPTMDAVLDTVVGRVLDQLGLANKLMPRWGEGPGKGDDK